MIIVTAWNNGKHHESGAGYGFKLNATDRDREIDRSWKSVVVELPNSVKVEANIDKASFWSNSCRELINKEFGEWLIQTRHAPWPKGCPPQFRLERGSLNRFILREG